MHLMISPDPLLASRTASTGRVSWLGWALMTIVLTLSTWGLFVAHQTSQTSDQVKWGPIVRLSPQQAVVHLPDSWKQQGLPPVGGSSYKLQFTLTEQGAEDSHQRPWSFRIDRLCAAHDVILNQRRLHSTLLSRSWLGEPAPAMIDVPGGMLQAGSNELYVDVQCVLHGGLSMPILAPKVELQANYLRYEVLTQYLPLGLNLCSMAFSMFVILLWWQRRQETAAGLFGLLYLLVSIRNCTYYITGDLGMPPVISSWLHLLAHTGSATLLGWFALSISGRTIPWFNRTLWVFAIGIPTVSVLTAPFDPNLAQTRLISQSCLQVLAWPSLWILFQLCRQSQMRSLVILALGFTSVLITGLHDFLYIRILGVVDHSYWMPWSVPLTLPGFTMILMNRMVKAFNDIEQLNQTLEQKVQERTRELAAVTAAKGHFLAAASHDLRQPVSAIGLITDLLHERLTDPGQRGLTDRLMRAVASMESLLKGLLDLSRLDSGTVEVHLQAVPLQKLLESIASHESESAHYKGLSLRVRPTHAVAWTDPILLEQILRNLVGNAVRHTERGGILVGVRHRPDHLLIQVWDTGSGISDTDKARIFDDFVQLTNPARERRRGLGLGLAIVKRASKLLNHPIDVRSQPHQGSCFSVKVPIAATSAKMVTPNQEQTSGASTEAQIQPWLGCHALVIEDDQTIRDALSNLLRTWGFKVTCGPGLTWLTQHGHQEHWDLLISDHRLADGTGREAVQYIRSIQCDTPALIVTGDTSTDQLNMLAHSGLPVLHKPFRSEKLRAMIQEIMARQ